MLFISKLDGRLSCSEHDPCGPEPLEPGEIREFVPEHAGMYPGKASTTDEASETSAPSSGPAGSPSVVKRDYSPVSSYGEEDSMERDEIERVRITEGPDEHGEEGEESPVESRYTRGKTLNVTVSV